MKSLFLTERDNMQYDRTLDGRNSANSVVLAEKKERNITVHTTIGLKICVFKENNLWGRDWGVSNMISMLLI